MSLPKHVKLSDCVADPGKRANHIYHPRTDEVFHVAPELAASILKMQGKAGGKGKSATLELDVPGTEMLETPADASDAESGLTITEEGEDSNKGTVENNRAELLEMAETLELDVPEGISDADLMALVEQAVQQ